MATAGIRIGNTGLTIGASMMIILLALGAIWYFSGPQCDDCIDDLPDDEQVTPLAIQARCDLGGVLSANDVEKGEFETAIAFLSINDEEGAKELADALAQYSWYRLSGTHGPDDIKGDNIPISQGGSELIPSNLRARYDLGRYVYMPGSSHDALIGMIEDNADNLAGLCK
tara:strand:- start:8 stop:517 length:510 start_codon:yes stop_codon:yes gene_type:complete